MIPLIIATLLIPFISGAETLSLGSRKGKFFYAGLVEETSTYRLAYYSNINIGTRVLKGQPYTGQNEPL
jgi:hypothetical protein